MRHECYRLCPSSGCFIEEMSLLGDGFVESSAFSRAGCLAAGADALEASSAGGCHRHEQDHNRGGNENHWPNLRIRSHVVCHPLCASNHPSSWCRSHQSWSFPAEALRLKGCVVFAGLLVIFGFITDLGSRCSIRICQNITMISLSVAGLLLLLNVVLISSILSVDQLIGWGSIDVLAANHLKIVLVFGPNVFCFVRVWLLWVQFLFKLWLLCHSFDQWIEPVGEVKHCFYVLILVFFLETGF